ncbi:MAG: hypothetical protein H6742_00590 [Alphaproteobacteria bacterium]|nr:hypothetical protein [Alphaproteobacteria bacterium]
MTSSPTRDRLIRLLPWVLLILWVGWLTSPLYRPPVEFFGQPVGDSMSARYYFHYVSEVALGRQSADVLGPLGHPAVVPRQGEFPTIVEGYLGVPFHMLFRHPLAFQLTMAFGVLVNALGAAVLARALGARGVGILFAGVLASLSYPMWRELIRGRPNAMWIGIPLLAIGAVLLATGTGVDSERPSPPLRAVPSTLTTLALAPLLLFAALVYPPHCVVLAPVAVALFLVGLHRRVAPRLLLAMLAAGAAVALGWEELTRLLAFGGTRTNVEIACDVVEKRMTLERWAVFDTHRIVSMQAGGVTVGMWALAPLALLRRQGRARQLVLLLYAAFLVPVSLGVCQLYDERRPLADVLGFDFGALLAPIFGLARFYSDLHRVAIVGVALLVVASGVGLSALARITIRGRRWPALVLASALGVAAAWQSFELPLRIAFYRRPVPTADHLAPIMEHVGDAPLAVLPFDYWDELESVLYHPANPRFHPREIQQGVIHPRDPGLAWLYDLGWRTFRLDPPGAEVLASLGPGYVVLAPYRCAPPDLAYPQRQPCDLAAFTERISAALGPPTELADGFQVWALPGTPAPSD